MNVKMLKCLDVKMNKGFTLIESLIVMAMIAILSLALIPSFQSGRTQLSLDRSASKLAQDIRGIMEKAMSSQEYSTCGSGFEYGYGIYLEEATAGSYILFADCNGNQEYNSSDKTIEVVPFESGISILNLNTTNKKLDIVFEPPDPIVYISGGSSASIIIQSSQYTEKKKTININKVGLIDIN